MEKSTPTEKRRRGFPFNPIVALVPVIAGLIFGFMKYFPVFQLEIFGNESVSIQTKQIYVNVTFVIIIVFITVLITMLIFYVYEHIKRLRNQ